MWKSKQIYLHSITSPCFPHRCTVNRETSQLIKCQVILVILLSSFLLLSCYSPTPFLFSFPFHCVESLPTPLTCSVTEAIQLLRHVMERASWMSPPWPWSTTHISFSDICCGGRRNFSNHRNLMHTQELLLFKSKSAMCSLSLMSSWFCHPSSLLFATLLLSGQLLRCHQRKVKTFLGLKSTVETSQVEVTSFFPCYQVK